ncbi:MAG: menaquinone biosynthesis decarboxylase [Thermoplasmatota archaeon]
MSYDLRDFVETLEAKGELRRIRARVDPVLEISEIYDRVVKKGGPALLFENTPEGMPVLINALGTDTRMELALGRSPDEVGRALVELMKPKVPGSLREGIQALEKVREILSFPPKIVSSGPCQDVVERGNDVDLTKIPVLQCWPGDAGRFITLPQVFTHDPETGERNVGTYRMQVVDKATTLMHWQVHKHGALHYQKAKARGERLQVAVALGGDPAMIYGGTAPLPDGLDETMLAGYIRRERMDLVKGVTVDVHVPAAAEIVLEGYVDPSEAMPIEGPFGDHTGYYSHPHPFPIFHVTAVTRRRNAIYPTTVVGVPPQEDGAIGKATERLFLHLIRVAMPEVIDINMPVEGAFHNLMLVRAKKRYPGHARKIMMSLWGLGLMSLEKCIVVYDEDVDVQNASECLFAVCANVDPARDTFVIERTPTDQLDHAAPRMNLGSKLGIDATVKWPEEGPIQSPWPERIRMSEEIKDRVTRRWAEYGLD